MLIKWIVLINWSIAFDTDCILWYTLMLRKGVLYLKTNKCGNKAQNQSFDSTFFSIFLYFI